MILRENGVIIYTFNGKLTDKDDAAHETFMEALYDYTVLERPGSQPQVVVDLTNVTFMNSTGLGLILSARTSTMTRNGRLVLCGVQPKVIRLLRVTKLETAFKMFATRSEALASFSQRRSS